MLPERPEAPARPQEREEEIDEGPTGTGTDTSVDLFGPTQGSESGPGGEAGTETVECKIEVQQRAGQEEREEQEQEQDPGVVECEESPGDQAAAEDSAPAGDTTVSMDTASFYSPRKLAGAARKYPQANPTPPGDAEVSTAEGGEAATEGRGQTGDQEAKGNRSQPSPQPVEGGDSSGSSFLPRRSSARLSQKLPTTTESDSASPSPFKAPSGRKRLRKKSPAIQKKMGGGMETRARKSVKKAIAHASKRTGRSGIKRRQPTPILGRRTRSQTRAAETAASTEEATSDEDFVKPTRKKRRVDKGGSNEAKKKKGPEVAEGKAKGAKALYKELKAAVTDSEGRDLAPAYRGGVVKTWSESQKLLFCEMAEEGNPKKVSKAEIRKRMKRLEDGLPLLSGPAAQRGVSKGEDMRKLLLAAREAGEPSELPKRKFVYALCACGLR